MNHYIPKIYILYAGILDRVRRNIVEANSKRYPAREHVASEAERIGLLWEKVNDEDKIVRKLIEILTINPGYDLELYIVGNFRSMSVPLLVSLYKSEDVKISDPLILECIAHELIHRFVSSPRKEKSYSTKKYWEYIQVTYADYNFIAQHHFLVYAVLEKVLPLVLSTEALAEVNNVLDNIQDSGYKEAIALVKEKGADYFIKEFTELVTHKGNE
jgi:hypothetical protein